MSRMVCSVLGTLAVSILGCGGRTASSGPDVGLVAGRYFIDGTGRDGAWRVMSDHRGRVPCLRVFDARAWRIAERAVGVRAGRGLLLQSPECRRQGISRRWIRLPPLMRASVCLGAVASLADRCASPCSQVPLSIGDAHAPSMTNARPQLRPALVDRRRSSQSTTVTCIGSICWIDAVYLIAR